jgi:hypothetical protein
LTYAWDFGDGGSASGPSAAHTYVDPGRFLATLTVTNDAGLSSTASALITATCRGGEVAPWVGSDIGEPICPGGSSLEGSTVSLCAGGRGVSSSGDQMHFVYREVDGDFEITARLSDLEGGNASAGAGLMVRVGLGGEDPFVGLLAERGTSDSRSLISRCRWRREAGASPTSKVLAGVSQAGLDAEPLWLRIRRAGDELTVFASRRADGTFADVPDCCEPALSLAGPVLVGVAAYGRDSGDPTQPFRVLQARLEEVEIVPDPDGPGPGPGFIRGDANADGKVDISDGVSILGYLFLGGSPPQCLDAADADDSGELVITDAIYVLNHLFVGGPAPPPPHPDCGEDPTDDPVDCGAYEPCD